MFESLKLLWEKQLEKKAAQQGKEHFSTTDKSNFTTLAVILALVTIILIQLFVGKYLWNNFLTRLVPAIKPAEGVIDILAISLLFRLLFN
ncbi:MAG: hypothetical protein JSR17_00975 [Proteobacteria bacterium]|nr:hypothetical protein [Pseudomonadota bacterium]